MSQHPTSAAPAPTRRERAPATVRAATTVLVVLAVVLGLVTLLLLVGGVAGALTGTDVGPVDPARQLGRLTGGAIGLVVPLALTVLTVAMTLAVRARRSWPSRVLAVLAWVGSILVAGGLVVGGLFVAGTGPSVSGVLLVALLLAVPALVLALQVSAAVLLRRPSARAWDDDLPRGPRR